jgi:hypothetical protein
MSKFKIGIKYLTNAQTKYFMRGANFVKLGHFGRKQDATGTFDPEVLVSGVGLLPGFNSPNSTVQVYTVKKKSGGGYLKFQEMTQTVNAELQARGGSTEVIVAELDFYDLLDGDIVALVKQDPRCTALLDSPGKRCVTDSVVVVKKMKRVFISDLNVNIDVTVRMSEILNGQIGADVSTMSYQDLNISPGTVLAFRLIQVKKKRDGGFFHKRDHPGR